MKARVLGAIHLTGRGTNPPTEPPTLCYWCDLPLDAAASSIAHSAPDGISLVHETCCRKCEGEAS